MLDKLNPFVRMAADVSSTNVSEYRVVGRDHRLIFVNSGSAVIYIKGVAHTLSPESLLYIPAYVDYEFRFGRMAETIFTVLNFDFDCERSGQKETLKTVPFESYGREKLYTGYVPSEFSTHILMPDAAVLGKDMQKIRALFFNKEAYYRDFASATLKSLLLKMIARSQTASVQESALGIISYIKEHYCEKLTAKDLSSRFGYHPNHINRLVKLNTGRGFKDFLIHFRLRVAKDMLASTSDSITAISENTGFSTSSYFAELFLKYEGMTPREYRNLLRSRV